MPKILTPAARAWLYPIALAVVVLAGVYGLVTDEQAAAWAAFAAAVLSGGVATIHRPTKS